MLTWKSDLIDIYKFDKPLGFLRTSLYATPSGGVAGFGYGVRAYLYEISWYGSGWYFLGYMIMYDCDGIYTYFDRTCAGACSDSKCHPTHQCFSSTTACTSCDSTGCKVCGETNKDPSTYCNQDCPANCDRCSSSTLCTQCKSGSFLYDKAGAALCIACLDSCTSCTATPDCFYCTSSIVQVDSIGYQISFSAPYIELDFAHPLVSTLTINSIGATLDDGTVIDTSNWTLNSCVASAVSCTITANSLSVSQLPLNMVLKFNQA
ncbi:unnamed protein product [Blepharisma stoltei]|uniref:TNFR-Cys domain-containing protein n=1 Tax=Blepharisma stoltei TaxID=1481888 RepID=A0AAU9IX57_9CILI|nr:unnamed protein product [Blepharisma stoltei]